MILPDLLESDAPLVWSTGRGIDVGHLFQACLDRDRETVVRLLDRDPSLARCQYAYRTPLYFAVRANALEIVALLLERGADPLSLAVDDPLIVVARDRGYREMEAFLELSLAQRCNASPRGEPVAAAIRDRDPARVRALLDAQPDLLHVGDERSNRPIHWAVMTRQCELIDDLLERGAAIDDRRYDGARPIHLTNGDYFYRGWRDVPKDVTTTPKEVYDHLVSRGATVDIVMAAAQGDIERVRAWLERDPSLANRVSDYGSYYLGCGAPLKNAATNGHIEIVRLLLERGADPNLPEEGIAPHGHALYAAVANRHHEIARLLLEHGANPNAAVESSADALSRAISNGDQPMIDLLCTHGASREAHLLAYYDDLRTAAAAFAANPALANDPEALENAASDAFVRLLLHHCPDLPRRVTVAKSPATTELLFRHGMDPNRRDWLAVTPLHGFARSGDLPKAMQFLKHGADLHARDGNLDSTPLAWAAKFGQLDMVEFLLRRGARIELPDDPPWATPLAWARRRGHTQIVAALEHYERHGTLPVHRRLDWYESVAQDVVTALASDDAASLQRVAEAFRLGRSPTAARLREKISELLSRTTPMEGCSLAEARLFVARVHGFDQWTDLENHQKQLEDAQARAGIVEAVEQAVRHRDVDGLAALIQRHPAKVARRFPTPRSAKASAAAAPAPAAPDESHAQARSLLVREHRFGTWDSFEAHAAALRDPDSAVSRFEAAVDAIVTGNLDALDEALRRNPDLIRARSDRPHRATLLNYVGANGVENFRQRTPPNAVAIAERLLEAGAEVDAVADLYGGSTTLGLVATSIHPLRAGVQTALMECLLAHGASLRPVPGAEAQGSIVNGCLANGRQAAAEFLANRGAPLDLEGAAGVGRLDVVRTCFDAAGRLRSHATEAQLKSGFQWACEYGRTSVAAYLLERGADPSALHRGQTGFHWAAYGGHADLVALFLSRGAPLEIHDASWNATPLGWAVHGWCHPLPGIPLVRHEETVRLLVAAGAVVDPAWLNQPPTPFDARLRALLTGRDPSHHQPAGPPDVPAGSAEDGSRA